MLGGLAENFNTSVRIGALVARRLSRRARQRLYLSPFSRWRFSSQFSDRLLLAPQDIRTADPTIANEIYGGRFSLAGQVAMVAGASPFALDPPSPEWQNALLGFGWLRHLRATESALARSQARALIEDWMSTAGPWAWPSAAPAVTARRIISWLSHSPLVLEGADRHYYRRFTRSLFRQTRYLAKVATTTGEGLDRLTAVIALNYAALCISGSTRRQRRLAHWLETELARQILPDGGHISRNPAAVIELLLDLLPLRQTFAAREIAPPPGLLNAIDRMMPMIRFFRHGDGTFALFNGMGASPADAIATVLAYDDSHGRPLDNASHSGYQRLAAGATVLIMDTGAPPPPSVSADAHAGCLSFEMSSGRRRIIVNCGHPAAAGRVWRRAARSTAAHSTASIGDMPSSIFASGKVSGAWLGELVLSGPSAIRAQRDEAAGGTQISAGHDGYRSRFGIIHERRLRLSSDGRDLVGEDLFKATEGRADAEFAIRFHLHPDIRATIEPDRRILLQLPNREAWAFAVQGGEAVLEESVYLPDLDGPRRSEQIVIHGRTNAQPRIGWSLACVQAARQPAPAKSFQMPEAPRR